MQKYVLSLIRISPYMDRIVSVFSRISAESLTKFRYEVYTGMFCLILAHFI